MYWYCCTLNVCNPCHSAHGSHMLKVNQYRRSTSVQWRHNGRDSIANHQPHDCLFTCLFRRRSQKTSKLRVTGLCAGNSPGTGEYPAQMASYAENVSIWWRHHVFACPGGIYWHIPGYTGISRWRHNMPAVLGRAGFRFVCRALSPTRCYF